MIKPKPLRIRHGIAILMLSLLSFSCNHYISVYDQFAYTQTTALKVDVLNLIDESTEPYASHEKEVETTVSNLRKAIEYERHRPKNDITVKMWDKMLDSTGTKGIVGSYLASWKKNSTKGSAIAEEYKPLAAEGFDLIADLEAQKIKSSDNAITRFLNK